LLEQFRVNLEEAEIVHGDALGQTVAHIFEKLGVPAEDAKLGADVLVLADLRGVDTHGVSNMLKSYITGFQSGQINPRPDWKVVRESPSTATIDSDRGLGTIITPKAMDIAIEKAKNVGLGMVTIGNARHLGMASYHSMMALEHDMIGICMTSCPPSVVPTYGAEPRLGTNPIAIAVPGWLADAEGNPIMEEIDAPDSYTLLPLGSTRELGSHKGYGLSCMVDIMAGLLTGMGYGAVPGRPNFGHYVAAYSIDAFTPVDEFKEQMDEWLQMMKSTKPAPGHERVLVAGQPEAEVEAVRRKEGIPFHPEVLEYIRDTCAELSVPCLV